MVHLPSIIWFWRAFRRNFRARLHGSEVFLLVLAALAGAIAGVSVYGITIIAQHLHQSFFDLPTTTRTLSGIDSLKAPWMVLVPVAGGFCLAGFLYLDRRQTRRPVDPIEANALYGGRMSINDSVRVAVQTLISNGFGLSVGLEACYAQVSSAIASRLGRPFDLRRGDMRTLVGCGAAAAIAAAFSAPLAGAFYAFETIIGTYAIGTFAPVMISAFMGATLMRLLAGRVGPVDPALIGVPVVSEHYFPAVLLGLCCSFIGIIIMLAVTELERNLRQWRIPPVVALPIGGLVVGCLGLISPQALSSGHGALLRDLVVILPFGTFAVLLALKVAGAIISLGSGFRGGLFYASLLLGALTGSLFAEAWPMFFPKDHLPITIFAIVGMAAFASTIIGGPMTMIFLSLELTRDLAIGGLVLVAVTTASLVTRKTFGYSFATWRFHARGEAIHSAHDIGWINSLTVGSMMRRDFASESAESSLSQFRRNHPLGKNQRVVLIDDTNCYVGIVRTADAYDLDLNGILEQMPVSQLARYRDVMLTLEMNVKEAAVLFQNSQSEALAVVDSIENGRLLGILAESYALRRYAEELDKRRGELIGEST